MRKIWRRIFLLCAAFMICMQGLCLAENWVQYYRIDLEDFITNSFIDIDSIKAWEYKERKYLGVNLKSVTEYPSRKNKAPIEGEKLFKLVDIENERELTLHNYSLSNGQISDRYFDILMNSQKSLERSQGEYELHTQMGKIPVFKAYLQCAEQNRPDVINEIRTHNLTAPPLPSAPQPAPGANTGATGSPNVPRGSLEAIVGDIEYEVLGSGAVKFNVRCPAFYGDWLLYRDTNYIFTKPEIFKAYPGTYMIGRMDDDGTIYIGGGQMSRLHGDDAFDYDPKTQTFTFYDWNYGPEGSKPSHQMRVIDKNTIYIKTLDGTEADFASTYRYMSYDSIPLKITKVDTPEFECEYTYIDYYSEKSKIGHAGCYFDDNQCIWFGNDIPSNHIGDYGYIMFFNGVFSVGLNVQVDMARAFLAVNGNVGAAPGNVVQ